MAGFDLATAYVQIVPTTEGIGGKIQEALSGEAGSAGDSAGETAGGNLASKLISVVKGAGIALAVKGAVDAIGAAINDVASAGDEIDKTSQKLGVSAREYQALSFAAEHCGFSTSTFSTAVKKLQQSGYEGTLTDYLDSLMEIEDPAERAAAAQEMLGEKVANEMAAYINGGQSMSEYADQLESLGGIMSDEAVAASAAYEDAMTDMQHAMDGVKTSVISTFLPSCTQVMTGVAQLVSGSSEGFSSIAEGVGGFIDNVVSVGQGIIEAAPVIITTLATGIETYLPDLITKGVSAIGYLAKGLITGLPSLLASGAGLVKSIVVGIANSLPDLIYGGVSALREFIVGIVQAIPELVQHGPEILESLINGIKSAFSGLISLGKDIMSSIWNGITGASNGDGGEEVAASTAAAVANYDYSAVGTNVATSIETSISSGADMSGAGEDIANSLMEYIGGADYSGVGSESMEAIAASITESLPVVEESMTAGAETSSDAFSGIQWTSAGVAADSGIASGIKSGAGGIAAALRVAANMGKVGFTSVGWYSVGANIIAGIKAGVSANSASLSSQMRSVASSALKAAKDELSIKSPSRKFRDEIGKNMMLGWAAGISDNGSVLYDAVNETADNAANLASREIRSNKTGRVVSAEERMIELLETIASKDLSLSIGNREFRRSLEDQGVKFA